MEHGRVHGSCGFDKQPIFHIPKGGAMSPSETILKLKDANARLAKLLNDPQIGLHTWWEALQDVVGEIDTIYRVSGMQGGRL
jgi:hypothetical protein